MAECTCTKCGWVHLAVTKDDFEVWGSEPRYTCFSCGGRDFRGSRVGDCPRGVTLQAVVRVDDIKPLD